MGFNEIVVTVATAVIGGVVWCIRLEGKVKAQDKLIESQEKRLTLLQEKHDNLSSRIMSELSCIREALARLEGRLDFRSDSHKA